MPPRRISDKLVCYVCQTMFFKPDDCMPVNIIISGYGVCFDHQFVIERALNLSETLHAIIRERNREP